jgi:cullin 1
MGGILGAAYWPLSLPTTHISPPNIIAQNNERYAKFYKDKYEQRRKLIWLWPLCTGEMKVNFCKISHTKDSPSFQVSAY